MIRWTPLASKPRIDDDLGDVTGTPRSRGEPVDLAFASPGGRIREPGRAIAH
jgi:hypothetical protein